MNIGICSVALGLFFVGTQNTLIAKADRVNDTVVQKNSQTNKSAE